ncbi:MAG: group III truncated hemoglobin [Bacteroidota bacterium]|nr:group III truncated hemoglobin [Bacteroidota bacterium]
MQHIHKKDIENRSDLKVLVYEFYVKIKKDELLGSIFIKAIGNNWDAHMERVVNFWESILFHQNVYNGQPYPKHEALPISTMHFEQWLKLFYKTVDAHFMGERANEVKTKASGVASVFMAKLFSDGQLVI